MPVFLLKWMRLQQRLKTSHEIALLFGMLVGSYLLSHL
jgi:hypothetical protein